MTQLQQPVSARLRVGQAGEMPGVSVETLRRWEAEGRTRMERSEGGQRPLDTVAAVVEVIAGPHRLVSLMTAEAVDDLGLEIGMEAVCVVKATNVIVEIPSPRDTRS
jgi:molybdopterin-binding protein